MLNLRKAAVIGLGNVGSSIAFALLSKGLYNELVLIDHNVQKAEGEALDLGHGIPYSDPMRIYSGTYQDVADASIIIITAGAAQKPGETRLDLITKNIRILSSIIDEIKKTSFEGILLIVANPVDVLTHEAVRLSGYPENRVFGSGTVLDTARLKYQVGQALKVDMRTVHTMIIGEHGDSEVPLWSLTNISGIPLKDFCQTTGIANFEKKMHEIYVDVRDSAYTIIQKKGATYYGIAMAVARICEAIVKDEHAILPLSNHLHGQYGIEGISFAVPSIVSKDGISPALEVPVSGAEQLALLKSARAMKDSIEKAEAILASA